MLSDLSDLLAQYVEQKISTVQMIKELNHLLNHETNTEKQEEIKQYIKNLKS